MKPDRDAIALALDHYLDAPGLLGLTALPADRRGQSESAYFETTSEGLEKAVDWVVDHDRPGVVGVYHRGTTLSSTPPPGARGTDEDSQSWTRYQLDLDYGKDGYAPDAETVLKIAATANLPDPSEWEHSGHGLYPIWHLARPVAHGSEVTKLGEAIHAEMARAFAEHGYKIDKVTDAARIWRIRGTVNRKYEPVLATQHSNGGPVLAWGDLRAAVPVVERKDAQTERAPTVRAADDEPESLTTEHAENIVRQAVTRLAALKPSGKEFRDTAYYLAKVTGLQVRAEGGSRADAQARALERFGDAHPGLVPNDDDLQWIEDGINAAGDHPGWTLTGPRKLNASSSSATAESTEDELDELAHMVHRLRLRREAQRILDAEERPPPTPPRSTSLAELLAEEPSEAKYRVDRMWPTGGKILLTAPKKSGKTTLVGNLLRCLADEAPFLTSNTFGGHQGFAVAPTGGRRILLLDFEMTRDMLREWLADQRINNLDAIHVELMRGRTWDPRDQSERRRWADYLRQLDVGTLIVDPIGPVVHGLGLEENSNSQVGGLLNAVDQLCADAGVGELAVVHHAGHGADQRSRGASVFLGWPDAVWELKRDDETGKRFLTAEGRDVYLPETALSFDWPTRRLALGALGGRAHVRAAADADIISVIVEDSPGQTVNGLKGLARDTEIGTKVQRVQDAIKAAKASELIHVHEGPNRAQHHYPGPRCDECSEGGGPK